MIEYSQLLVFVSALVGIHEYLICDLKTDLSIRIYILINDRSITLEKIHVQV